MRNISAQGGWPAPHDEIAALNGFDNAINVDQSPIGRTPRSNPAAYTGRFNPIRELFSQVPMVREHGYGARRFRFNAGGGRILVAGTPETVADCADSVTGRFLKPLLAAWQDRGGR